MTPRVIRLQPANPLWRQLAHRRLVWSASAGVGYYECEQAHDTYGRAYFDRYAAQADTVIGRRLMAHRVELVKRHVGDVAFAMRPVLDVGIGCGAFVDAVNAAGGHGLGFDVNPAGVEWLMDRGAWRDLYRDGPHPIVTFWDALEHIRDPRPALDACGDWAFVALPIFRDEAHALGSRHFRPDEHYWYFTRDGFRRFAEDQGFAVVDMVATESALGREDIETFVLRRRG